MLAASWALSSRLLHVPLADGAETDVRVGPPGLRVESAVMAAHVGEAPIGAADDPENTGGRALRIVLG